MKTGLMLWLCIFPLISGLILPFGDGEKPLVSPSSEVNLSVLSYHWQGMTRPVDYQLKLSEDGESVMAEMETAGGWMQTTPDVSVMLEAERILEKYAVAEWDGFSGTDPDVLDGEAFSLYAEFCDGHKISASGNNRFPPNYWEVSAALNALAELVLQMK